MKRPCLCDNCAIGEPFVQGTCWPCWKYHNDPDYRTLWEGDAAGMKPLPQSPRPRTLPRCPFLGDRVIDESGQRRNRWCAPCGRNKPLYRCNLWNLDVTAADCANCGAAGALPTDPPPV
jgi:hypothetical protein